MASKSTPKKHYKKGEFTGTGSISRCRLCNCVADPKHSKSLFLRKNQAILHNAEKIFGGELPQESNFPAHICAPCERRLNNAIQFNKVITETQKALAENVRTKRCVDISPTVVRPTKVRAAGNSRRRSIDFNVSADDTQSTSPILVSNQELFFCPIYYLILVLHELSNA